MSLRSRRGTALFAVLLLVGALGSPVLASEGREVRGGWWSMMETWLNQAMAAVGLQPVFETSRCGIDPNGQPIPCPGTESPQEESACSIDPNGQPQPCPNL